MEPAWWAYTIGIECMHREPLPILTFIAFGLKVGISVNDPSLLEHLPAYLPYSWSPAPNADLDRHYALLKQPDVPQGHDYELLRDGAILLGSSELDEVLDVLERDIRWLLADEARDWIFIHAGAVGWRERAIVLPGASGAGKSSLVAELVNAGALY